MGDAEQAKGQVSEARKFASKYDLNDLTAIIDRNHYQISGRTEQVMPVDIKENYAADGWKVLEVNGHDFRMLIDAIETATSDHAHHYVIIAQTAMGHGVSFMEKSILRVLKPYLDVMRRLQFSPPYFLLVSAINVQGWHICYENAYGHNHYGLIDRSMLAIPELVIEDYEIEPAMLLKPAFDAIWNAAGMERCLSYDKDGKYKIPEECW